MKRKMVVLGISLGILAVGALLAYLVYTGLQIPCLFRSVTGLLCPGCGNTRATLALLRLDFKAVLRYNLSYPLQILYILRLYLVCAENYIRGGRFAYHTKPDWVDISCLSLLLVWTVIRNCIPL
ncbi:MAG: DUF2752 domain-containing protein [Oscillospiraceae bacterium]|nr:DUF2752 domain-containing protein [Oscillospiraceae bacterium]